MTEHDAAAHPEYLLLIVSYLFLTGVSQAGVVFSATLRLVNAEWAKPYYRLAELCTLAFAPFAIAGFLLIYYLARHELFYWLATPYETLHPWLDGDGLLIRNLFALLLFYGLSGFYTATGLRPDLAGAASSGGADNRAVERRLYLLSPWVLLAFVLCNTLFAWDFAMMLIPHWHSTVFPIHFWFGNVFAGTAALMAFPALLGRLSAAGSRFGPREIRSLSMLITGFTLLWLYFYWAQYFVIWFGNMPREADPLWRQMYGHYAPFYWTMMLGCFFVPFVALIFSVVNRSVGAMCVVALGICAGIWVNKYLMVVPIFQRDHRPLEHLPDVGLSVALLAAFLVVLVTIARRLPAYSYWEMGVRPP